MNRGKRPLSVTVLAVIFIAVGAIGFVYHLPGLQGQHGFQSEDLWIELTEAAALLSGVFLWRGRNWARWLASAWILFHVLLSAFHTLRELIIHAGMGVVIAAVLFAPPGTHYFRRETERTTGE